MGKLIDGTVLGLFFGTVGTLLGGIIGVKFKKITDEFLGNVLGLAAGLMSSIVAFELIPRAIELDGVWVSILGIIIGIVGMQICDIFVEKKLNYKNRMMKVGLVISLGLAIHNIPEGIAIGSGFDVAQTLGLSLAISIAIHDLPEGISMAVPLKKSGIKNNRIIFYVFLSGIATGVGALIGTLLGEVSKTLISISLSMAAGAMIYVVSGELLPEVSKCNSKFAVVMQVIGLLLGLLCTYLF